MKSTTFLSVLLSLYSFGVNEALAAASLSSAVGTNNPRVVPGRYIVEVDNSAQIPGKRSLVSAHERVYSDLRKRGVGYQVDQEYKVDGLFSGASVTLDNPNDITQLKDASGVIAVRPVILIPPPLPIDFHIVTGLNDPKLPPDSESTHVMTGVNKLHAEGYNGKGVKIGIIDTGIDYNHPSLGGGFGSGHKVIGGYDFVGDAFNGSNTPVPDNDPLDECNGHGTHVAGIIAADPGNQYNISGVAPSVSLNSYRVFGCNGSVPDDVLVSALLRAHQDNNDIITMSLGGVQGWSESTTAVLSSRLADQGTILTIAAGNDGNYGSWYSSSPGTALDAIGVASVDNTVIPLQNATVHGVQHDPITYFETLPFNISGNLPIYATSTNTSVADDACNALPDNTPDLSSFLVVIRRGTCAFTQKLTNAAAKGGKVFFIYDNGNGFAGIETGSFKQAALIQAADGEFLVSQFAAKANISISFPQTGGLYNFPVPPSQGGGLISSFTSYGPTDDMYMKPSVAAPGGNILSTLPIKLGSWGVESGTSMATPFLAGSAALIVQGRGKGFSNGRAVAYRTLFQTTAQRVASSHSDSDPLQTVAQQGAGLIDVYKAMHTETIVSTGELLLNDTANFAGSQSFSITNNGWWPKTYSISHIPAGTASTIKQGSIFANDGPVPLTAQYATVDISQKSVTVWPMQTSKISVKFTPPAGVDPSTYPVYSGFIAISDGTSSDSTHVAYIGLAASIKDKQILDNTDTYFGSGQALPAVLDASGNIINSTAKFSMNGSDVPTVVVRLAFGTPLLQLDLADATTNISTTYNKRGSSASSIPIIGNLFSQTYIPRNSDATTVDDNGYYPFPLSTTFANGTNIPAGSYRVLVRALRTTGDSTNEDDYESWISPVFDISA